MRNQELNPARLASLFRRQFELCNVKQGETIALLSDLNSPPEYIQASFAAASELGADAYAICVNSIPSWTKVGVETIGACKGTLDALAAADMLVCLHIPLFTKWMKAVRDANTRVLMIIDAPDDLEQLMAPPGLREAVVHAGARLEQTKTVRVTSEAGTDLTYDCGDYPAMIQYGFADAPGRFDHWGGGHVHTFPNEGSASGTVVIQPGDIVVLPYNRYVQDAIHLEIANGHITKISGGMDAKLMEHWLDDNKSDPDDLDGHYLSHLGWGLNPQARWDALALYGNDPDRTYASARTFAGNFLFSTGPNSQGGGTRTTTGHYDVPMRGCTVMLDNDMIIDKGSLVDEVMVVERVAR
jgi:2,5-dihydroxypyridine 5,6-dioxygenase